MAITAAIKGVTRTDIMVATTLVANTGTTLLATTTVGVHPVIATRSVGTTPKYTGVNSSHKGGSSDGCTRPARDPTLSGFALGRTAIKAETQHRANTTKSRHRIERHIGVDRGLYPAAAPAKSKPLR